MCSLYVHQYCLSTRVRLVAHFAGEARRDVRQVDGWRRLSFQAEVFAVGLVFLERGLAREVGQTTTAFVALDALHWFQLLLYRLLTETNKWRNSSIGVTRTNLLPVHFG